MTTTEIRMVQQAMGVTYTGFVHLSDNNRDKNGAIGDGCDLYRVRTPE